MCISDTKYTLKLWYHVLTQAKITLNIICPSRLQHQLFDQFHIAQQFDCKNHLIVHPGTCVVVNIKTIDCLYRSPRGNTWWYIGPTLGNYHLHSVYIIKTREEQVINTVNFSPNFTMSCMTLGDAKTFEAHYVAQLLPPKYCQTHTINQVR